MANWCDGGAGLNKVVSCGRLRSPGIRNAASCGLLAPGTHNNCWGLCHRMPVGHNQLTSNINTRATGSVMCKPPS